MVACQQDSLLIYLVASKIFMWHTCHLAAGPWDAVPKVPVHGFPRGIGRLGPLFGEAREPGCGAAHPVGGYEPCSRPGLPALPGAGSHATCTLWSFWPRCHWTPRPCRLWACDCWSGLREGHSMKNRGLEPEELGGWATAPGGPAERSPRASQADGKLGVDS